MTIKQRDIFLVPFPFSDLTSTKRRPVLTLSPSSYNSKKSDLIVCAVTSSKSRFSDGIVISNKDMDVGYIVKISAIRSDKLFSLSKKLIIKYIGKLNKNKSKDVVKKLESTISIVE